MTPFLSLILLSELQIFKDVVEEYPCDGDEAEFQVFGRGSSGGNARGFSRDVVGSEGGCSEVCEDVC